MFSDLPGKTSPALTITRVLKADWMLLDFLVYLWAVTVGTGAFYLLLRDRRQDVVLHWCALDRGWNVSGCLCMRRTLDVLRRLGSS